MHVDLLMSKVHMYMLHLFFVIFPSRELVYKVDLIDLYKSHKPLTVLQACFSVIKKKNLSCRHS